MNYYLIIPINCYSIISSVKITPDGNLAGKLELLSGQAEAKLKEIAELERQQIQNCPQSNLQTDKR